MYSFAICLWEIWHMGCEGPYHGLPTNDVFAGVLTGSLRPAIPEDMDPE